MPGGNLKKQQKPETVEDMKKQPSLKKVVQKGYNEKNIHQEQGAFKPDNAKKS
ncbi:MAG: hypothetical protein ABIY51_00065 [Ferruginibacter sp.]